MSSKGKKLLPFSHIILTPCNYFTENSFSWLWSSPGRVQALPPIPCHCRPLVLSPCSPKDASKELCFLRLSCQGCTPGNWFFLKDLILAYSPVGLECRVKSYSADLDNVIRWRQMIFKQAFPLISEVDFFQLKKKKKTKSHVCLCRSVVYNI